MKPQTPAPEAVVRLKPDQVFRFACHPQVACFTECCRLLDLVLTPYDVLRLRRGTGFTSQQLHDQYIIEEHNPDELFPKYYLTMIDDGRASCVFVSKDGCAVYEHRPGACRAYPLGRAAIRGCQGKIQEHHVLLKENHCLGFAEGKEQIAQDYSRDQGLDEYNRHNDALASLIQHPQIRQKRFSITPEQLKLYSLALYNIDNFRSRLEDGSLEIPAQMQKEIPGSDEELLLFAINWLIAQFFPEDR